MCGRYVSASSPQQIADYFGATSVAESLAEPNYNVAPTTPVPAIRSKGGERHLDLLRWGLIPSWAKNSSIGNKLINARVETVTEKNAFRAAIKRRRCIIPADAFYEWTTVANPNGKKPLKQPWCIERVDGDPFSFAGLFEVWRGPEHDEPPLLTCTILTTVANQAMSEIHDRMPVLLTPQHWQEWIDPQIEDAASLLASLPETPSELLTIYPVSTAVNNSRSRGAQLLERIELQEQLS